MQQSIVPESLEVGRLALLGPLSVTADEENAAAKGNGEEDDPCQDRNDDYDDGILRT